MNKLICKARAALNKKGEMYVSKVVWTLAVIIVGMLLMWGIYEIVDVCVLPGLNGSISDIFGITDDNISDDNYTSTFTATAKA